MDTTNQSILFQFDKALDPTFIAAADAARFRYQTTSNDPQRQGSTTRRSRRRLSNPQLVGVNGVRVFYVGTAGATGDCPNPCNVGDARRFIVEKGAVTNETPFGNPDNGAFNATNVVAATGGTAPNATIPTLLSATKVAATRATWDLKYSTNVEANTIDGDPTERRWWRRELRRVPRGRHLRPPVAAPGASRSGHAAGHVRHRGRGGRRGSACKSDRRRGRGPDSLGVERKADDKIVLIADDPQVTELAAAQRQQLRA